MLKRVQHDGAALVLGAMVVLLGWAAQHGLLTRLDEAGLVAMAGGPAAFWRIVSRLGDTSVRFALAAAVAVALLTAARRGEAVMLLATVLGGAALNSGAKLVATRPRPGFLPHLEHVDTFSFPSGHSAGAMVLGLALAVLAPRRWRGAAVAAAVVVALLIGLSRMALAVHWPSDVVAGWLLGAAWVLLVRATVPALARLARDGGRQG